MTPPRALVALLAAVFLGSLCPARPEPSQDELQTALVEFWEAPTLEERDRLAQRILASAPDFDELLARLRTGREHASDVPRGRLLRERTGVDGRRHPHVILVPDDYTPEQRWPVRIDLHGGMGAQEWTALDGAWNPGWRAARGQIVVLPAGWWDSMWWEWSQVENLEALLREVRATWNVDENRVVLYGSSDGGAALFFHALRAPDRFCGFAGSVAPPDRLVRADFRPDGQMHLSNLAGQRFHLDYGEKDTLVPWRFAERYLELFERNGALLDWRVWEGQGHDLSLPPEREQELARFLWHTERDPLPDTLSWATERVDRYARRSWLVIDELEPSTQARPVDDSNLLPRWGTRLQLRGPTAAQVPWGRVDLEREGNLVRATTRRVKRFTLLLSPDELDLARPVVVELNGQVAFDGRVPRSSATLLKWAARDEDPSRLFAAELTFEP